MSLMIATPMYAGQCSHVYVRSALELQLVAAQSGMEVEWLFIDNESLVSRARNTIANRFLESDCQKLLFIDADIEFSSEDVAELWNQNEEIIGASVPLKGKGMHNAWKDGRMVRPDGEQRTPRVDYVGSAFLMVDRHVFETMSDSCDGYVTRHEHQSYFERDFFSPFVHNRVYLSEDYAFCKRARDQGFRPRVDKSIVVRHKGSAIYGH